VQPMRGRNEEMGTPGPLKAVIFDFNGVILDDEEYHFESLKKVLGEEGVDITREAYFRDCLGFNDEECFLWGLRSEASIRRAGGMAALIARKSAYYGELLRQQTRFFPGVIDLVRACANVYHLAVASMAMREEIVYALRTADIERHFKVIVAAEDVLKTKPDPEVYQKALAELNKNLHRGSPSPLLSAGQCLVIEDSLPGILAAKAAGMRCLAVANSVAPELLEEADWRCASLEGLTPEALEKMYNGSGSG